MVQKEESFEKHEKEEEDETWSFLDKNKKVGGICGRKPQTLFG
jgi:hypothetical protein